jgi:hypothetical protein
VSHPDDDRAGAAAVPRGADGPQDLCELGVVYQVVERDELLDAA